MNNASTKYRVDNWQIPVPIGDASAHFLVKVAAGNQKGKVINAFFMDGGENAHKWSGDSASDKISEALAFIDEQYESKTWKFDAIVTTHHNADHFKGLKDLLGVTKTRGGVTSTYRKLYFADKLIYYSGNPGERINSKLEFIWSPDEYYQALAGEDAIGIDMFSRTRIFYRYEKTKALESYDKKNSVRQWNPVGDELRRPRFVIVGANGYGVHLTQADSIMEKEPNENQKSLLAVVYWPSQGRTSYFTGGDGNPKVELEGVVPWMNRNATEITDKNKYYPRLPVDMVKLDHHGSLRETLNDDGIPDCHSTILDMMRPRNVLVTPGNRHGHPNWVVMQLVRNHFIKIPSGGRMYTTRSPYWMSKENINVLDANTNHASFGKVKEALNTIGKPGDEEEFGHDFIFKAEMEKWPEDYTQNEKLIEDWAEQLKTLQGWQGYFKRDGKPNLKIVKKRFQKELQEEKKKTKKQLKASKQEPKSGKKTSVRVGESELTNAEILDLILQENRSAIVWYSREAWSNICDQEICDRGSPYFLIRFWFEEDGGTFVDCTMDEDGQKKRSQDSYGTKKGAGSDSDYIAIEDGVGVSDEEAINGNGHSSKWMIEGKEVTDNNGRQFSQVIRTNPKSGIKTKSVYEYTLGVENYEQFMAYIRFRLGNFGLTKDFINIKTVDEMEAEDSYEWFLSGTKNKGKRDVSPKTSALGLLTSRYIDPRTAPSSEVTGKGRQRKVYDIIESADWSEMGVTDPSVKGRKVMFSGDEEELLNFKLFVGRYCQRDLKAYVTNKGPKLDGLPHTRRGREDRELLKNLFEQWTGLRDHRASAAAAQYRAKWEEVWRPLKMERHNELFHSEDSQPVLGKRNPTWEAGKDPKPAQNGGRGMVTRSRALGNPSSQDATGQVEKKFMRNV